MDQNKIILQNREGYDLWSSFYDIYPNPTVFMDEIHFPPVWSHLTGKRILEIGCGTGRHTSKLLKQDNHVLGLDLSPGMLAEAAKKLPREKLQLREADFMTCKDLPKQGFDAVVESLVLEHISELDLFFQKAAAVLKPEGELFISEIHPRRALNGIFAHFRDQTGQEIHLRSFPHVENDVEKSAFSSGFKKVLSQDVVGDDDLKRAESSLRAKWARFAGQPMIKIWVFAKEDAPP